MSDYIKREDAEEILADAIKQAEENTGCVIVDIAGWGSIESYAEEAMSDAPTADVEPVRHGRWVVDSGILSLRCSECNTFSYGETWKYCPNCGARMDGEEE